MNKNKRKSLIAALVLFTLLPMTVLPSSAMTPIPPSLLDGAAYSGAQMPSESGVVIENQSVTFDLGDFPLIRDAEGAKKYSGTVTTEYTLFNPSDTEITLRVAYPIADTPTYLYGIDAKSDAALHSITINDKKINPELRYGVDYDVYSSNYSHLGSIISDEYISNEFCSPDMTVTKYTFKQTGVKQSGAYIGFDVKKYGQLTGSCIYLGEYANAWDVNYDYRRFNIRAIENGSTFDMYVFGKDLSSLPKWTVYKDFGVNDGEEIEGKIEFVSKETTTFSEFVSGYYDESLGINELDWYNMAATDIGTTIKNDQVYTSLSELRNGFLSYRAKGFIYDITIAPGERVTHTLTGPIYPDIETKYEPYTYLYDYILYYRNAEMFTGQINVKVNTPYYLLGDNGFTKTDGGYSLTLNAKDTIDENSEVTYGGINFTLSESENPEEIKDNSTGLLLMLILFVLLPIGLLIEVVESVVKAVKNGFNNLRSKITK